MWLWTGGCPPTPNVRLWFHRKMVSGTSSLKTLREEECLISSVPWKTNAERDLWYLKAIRTLKAIGKGLGVLSCCCAPSLSSSHEAALQAALSSPCVPVSHSLCSGTVPSGRRAGHKPPVPEFSRWHCPAPLCLESRSATSQVSGKNPIASGTASSWLECSSVITSWFLYMCSVFEGTVHYR